MTARLRIVPAFVPVMIVAALSVSVGIVHAQGRGPLGGGPIGGGGFGGGSLPGGGGLLGGGGLGGGFPGGPRFDPASNGRPDFPQSGGTIPGGGVRGREALAGPRPRFEPPADWMRRPFINSARAARFAARNASRITARTAAVSAAGAALLPTPPGFGRPLFARTMFPPRPLPGDPAFTGVPAAGETRFVTNELLVHVPPNVTPQVMNEATTRLRLTQLGSQNVALTGGTFTRFRINDGRPVGEVVQALEAERIGVAQPNYVYDMQQATKITVSPSATAPNRPEQYVVEKLHLPQAHQVATGEGVLIAVIDSQIDAKHPDLAGSLAAQFDPNGAPFRPDAHGTSIAGAIVAHQRLLGVAPSAKILAVRAFAPGDNRAPQATTQNIIAGLDWAVKRGAQIINMSFAGPYDPLMHVALQKAHDKGIVLVAAAGNAGPNSPPLYPAADENVIGVTATDENDRVLSAANQGPQVSLAAPGVDVVEPSPNGAYQMTSGTSIAAAHVSGVVALLLARNPVMTPVQVEQLLMSTARDLGPKGRDDQYGYGLVDPEKALGAMDAKVAQGRPVRPATAVNGQTAGSSPYSPTAIPQAAR